LEENEKAREEDAREAERKRTKLALENDRLKGELRRKEQRDEANERRRIDAAVARGLAEERAAADKRVREEQVESAQLRASVVELTRLCVPHVLHY
jgi:hypothetical protein